MRLIKTTLISFDAYIKILPKRMGAAIHRYIFIFIFTLIFVQGICTIQANAADTDSDQLGKFDFSKIDQSADTDINFKDLVAKIISGGQTSMKQNFIQQLQSTLTKELASNKTAIIQVIGLAIISAFFTNFSNAFNNQQISQAGFFVTCIALVTILMAIFAVAAGIATSTIKAVIGFMKALIPIYATSIAVTSGSMSSMAYYELILIIIAMVNWLFLNIIINGSYIFVMISAADCIAKEESLSKLGGLIKLILGWIIKTSLAAVIGLNAIQSLVLPVADSIQSNVLSKALGMIPGIGSGISAVSSTVIGAGTLVKNGIGVAALIFILIICLIPIVKLGIFVITYKFISAIVQPVADKRIVECINSISEGMNILLTTVIYSAIMFLITIAIICASTNVNYYAM